PVEALLDPPTERVVGKLDPAPVGPDHRAQLIGGVPLVGPGRAVGPALLDQPAVGVVAAGAGAVTEQLAARSIASRAAILGLEQVAGRVAKARREAVPASGPDHGPERVVAERLRAQQRVVDRRQPIAAGPRVAADQLLAVGPAQLVALRSTEQVVLPAAGHAARHPSLALEPLQVALELADPGPRAVVVIEPDHRAAAIAKQPGLAAQRRADPGAATGGVVLGRDPVLALALDQHPAEGIELELERRDAVVGGDHPAVAAVAKPVDAAVAE